MKFTTLLSTNFAQGIDWQPGGRQKYDKTRHRRVWRQHDGKSCQVGGREFAHGYSNAAAEGFSRGGYGLGPFLALKFGNGLSGCEASLLNWSFYAGS